MVVWMWSIVAGVAFAAPWDSGPCLGATTCAFSCVPYDEDFWWKSIDFYPLDRCKNQNSKKCDPTGGKASKCFVDYYLDPDCKYFFQSDHILGYNCIEE
jgi:hypothetical protein